VIDVRGVLAGDLAAELAGPMQALRDRLALLVDHIDRYVSHSTGPTPYPWQALQGLRQDLGAAYLESTLLVRQLDDVRMVLSSPLGEVVAVDCAREVEVALNLLAMKHAHVELIADVGATPLVRASAGALALVVTRLLWLCARSADGVAGSAISVRTWVEGEAVWISIADSGHGIALADREHAAIVALLEQWQATLEAVVAPGRGCGFELRLAAAPAG
jgi:signal transduction histidine kinase